MKKKIILWLKKIYNVIVIVVILAHFCLLFLVAETIFQAMQFRKTFYGVQSKYPGGVYSDVDSDSSALKRSWNARRPRSRIATNLYFVNHHTKTALYRVRVKDDDLVYYQTNSDSVEWIRKVPAGYDMKCPT